MVVSKISLVEVEMLVGPLLNKRLFMERLVIVAIASVIVPLSAFAEMSSSPKISCDFNKCISVCESDHSPEYSCPLMYGTIIELCTRIVLMQDQARVIRRKLPTW